MKKTLLTILCALSLSAASAQTLYNNEDNHSYFGARIGLDISSASEGYDVYSNGAGFNIGAIYHLPVKMNFYFEPGLGIFYDTFGCSAYADIVGGKAPLVDGSIRNFGFRIPFHFGYHFDFTDDISVSIYTGPQLNYSLTAKSHFKEPVFGFPYNESMFGEDGFKRTDLQWSFGVSLNYRQHYHVSIGGAAGLTKVMDTKAMDFRRNLFNIGIGYNF